MSKPKLIDVANEAGVSKSTVSQFLNGRFDYMSQDTKARVQHAVEKLQYVPNNIARSLKTDRTKTIGVIVRDVAGYYTSQAIRGMYDYCKSNGYNMIIFNTDFNPKVEAQALATLEQLRVDGMIIAPSGSNSEMLNNISNRDKPCVQFQLEHADDEKNIIISNYRQAAFDATEYLIELGHTNICFLTQKFESVKSRFERYQGYVAALSKHNITVEKHNIQYWQRESGFENSPRELLESGNAPSAFFAQHLAITTDLLREIGKASIRIPEDVSIIGFDEIPLTEFFKTPITVVKQEPYIIGHQTAKLLIKHLEQPGLENQRIEVPCSLVKRKSCKRVRKDGLKL